MVMFTHVQAVGNSSKPQFDLVKDGLLFSTGGSVTTVMFDSTSCMCTDASECMNDTNPLYQVRDSGGVGGLQGAVLYGGPQNLLCQGSPRVSPQPPSALRLRCSVFSVQCSVFSSAVFRVPVFSVHGSAVFRVPGFSVQCS